MVMFRTTSTRLTALRVEMFFIKAYLALAAGTAIHALAFTVIVADAPAKHTIRMLYPWSTLTDGGLLLFS